MEIETNLKGSLPQTKDIESPKIDLASISDRYQLCSSIKRSKSLKSKSRGDFLRSPSLKHKIRKEQTLQSQATFRQRNTTLDVKPVTPPLQHPLIKSFKKYRLEKLVRIFAQKLKQSVVLAKPFSLEQANSQQWTFLQRIFGEADGIDMNNYWVIAMQATGLIVSTWLVLIYSLNLVFRDVAATDVFRATQSIALIYLLAEVLLNFFVKVYYQGKIISEIRHIIVHYVGNNILFDLAYFILIIVDVSHVAEETMTYLRMIVILRFLTSLSIIDKLESMVCTSFRRQQQWGLAGLFIVNFLFAHALSICLNSMALVSDNNWWVKHSLTDDAWYVKYIYGYYWGINIMLTVGFGDLSASNWQEALCLIFIELISCILFTYNINCVGNLFNNLRLQVKQKEKNIKTFRRLCSQAHQKVVGDLQSRISYFIQKSFQIKNQYDLKGQQQTLAILPEKLKNQFKKRVNTKLLENLEFFKAVNRKSLEQIGVNITKRIVIPEEIIIKRGDQSKLLLLHPGQAAYIAYQQKRSKNESVVIQKVPAQKHSKLLSFKQFMKQQAQKYDIMATEYSVLYSLEHQSFKNILKRFRPDYEKYCQLRDSNSSEVFGGIQCNLCPKYYRQHSRFECPRLHYIPLRQIVCHKYQAKCKFQNRQKNKRLRNKHPNIYQHEIMSFNKLLEGGTRAEMFVMSARSLDVYRSMALIDEQKDYEVEKMFSWRNYFPTENVSNKIRKFNQHVKS